MLAVRPLRDFKQIRDVKEVSPRSRTSLTYWQCLPLWSGYDTSRLDEIVVGAVLVLRLKTAVSMQCSVRSAVACGCCC